MANLELGSEAFGLYKRELQRQANRKRKLSWYESVERLAVERLKGEQIDMILYSKRIKDENTKT